MSQVHKNSSDLEEEEEVGGVLCCVVVCCVVCSTCVVCAKEDTGKQIFLGRFAVSDQG